MLIDWLSLQPILHYKDDTTSIKFQIYWEFTRTFSLLLQHRHQICRITVAHLEQMMVK